MQMKNQKQNHNPEQYPHAKGIINDLFRSDRKFAQKVWDKQDDTFVNANGIFFIAPVKLQKRLKVTILPSNPITQG